MSEFVKGEDSVTVSPWNRPPHLRLSGSQAPSQAVLIKGEYKVVGSTRNDSEKTLGKAGSLNGHRMPLIIYKLSKP